MNEIFKTSDKLKKSASVDGRQEVSYERWWKNPTLIGGEIGRTLGFYLYEELERAELFVWLTLTFMVGILIYFMVPHEPELILPFVIFAGASTAAFWRYRAGNDVIPLLFLCALLAGFIYPAMKVALLEGNEALPYGPVRITGVLKTIEVSHDGSKRLTLSDVKGGSSSQRKLPDKVRIRVASRKFEAPPGATLQLLVRLKQPSGPVLPGSYDFGRALYFDGIGATGFSLGAPKVIHRQKTASLHQLSLEVSRQKIADRITANFHTLGADHNIPLAKALLVGQKASIDRETRDTFAIAGLAHLFAISGLHMALVVGTIIFTIRFGLSAMRDIAARYDVRRIAILFALAIGAFYYLISGMSVSSTRAFLMVGIIVIGMLLGARAISVHNLAVAALVVLLISPDELLQPGFQMSFAATLALISFMPGLIGDESTHLSTRGRLQEIIGALYRYLKAICLTSLIAGAATGIIAAYHFHHIAPFGLLANLLGMPIFATLIMPFGLIGLLVMPFGVDLYPFTVMNWGLDLISYIARLIALFSDDFSATGTLNTEVFFFVIALGIIFCLLKTRFRWISAFLTGILLVLLPLSEQPNILIAEDGKTVAIRKAGAEKQSALHVSGARAGRFEVDVWKKALAVSESNTGEENLFTCDTIGCAATINGITIAHVKNASGFYEDCRRADILISSYSAPENCPKPIAIIDKAVLSQGGAHAIYWQGIKQNKPALNVVSAIPAIKRPWHKHYASNRVR